MLHENRKIIKDNIINIKKTDINYDKFDNIISRSNDIYFICSYIYYTFLRKIKIFQLLTLIFLECVLRQFLKNQKDQNQKVPI